MKIRVSVAPPLSPKEAKRWEAWAAFCDKAQIAPDTLASPEQIARRFNEKTGGMTTPEWVRKLMPERDA